MLPYVGQAWWCALFILKDKRDEHQLCQFIIGFKTSQFITLGLGSTLLGILKYIRCTLYGSMSLCDTLGPMLSSWNTLFFLCQIALVWVAFFYLPYTERPFQACVNLDTAPPTSTDTHSNFHANANAHIPMSHHRPHVAQEETAPTPITNDATNPLFYPRQRPAIYQDVFGNVLHMDRGGYLMKLCGYETITLCIIMGLAMVVHYGFHLTWQRQMLLFWIRTLYGLLSFPFLPFKMPLLENVLLHTCRMGYDPRGRTVRMIPVKATSEDER
jgi:hypothetical protein